MKLAFTFCMVWFGVQTTEPDSEAVDPQANQVLDQHIIASGDAISQRPFDFMNAPHSTDGIVCLREDVRKERSRDSAQEGFMSPLCPGQHPSQLFEI